jgi:hypothetical protein
LAVVAAAARLYGSADAVVWLLDEESACGEP